MNGEQLNGRRRVGRWLRGVAPETWIWTVLSTLALVYGLRSVGFFVRMNAPLHFDDGYVTSIGERLLDGRGLPYVDAASHRGPVLYWLAALSQLLGGRMQWYGVRALTSLAFLSSTIGVWAAALGARRRFVGAIAALSFVFISLWLEEIQSVFGLVGEAIATPWLVVAFAFACWGLARPQPLGRRCWLLAAAGVNAALAGLCKQTYLPVVAPLALWALAAALAARGEPRRQRWGPLAALCGGWVFPLAGVVLVYAIAGELDTFYYWFFRYNVDVYMAPFQGTPVPKTIYHWLYEHGYLAFSACVLWSAIAGRHFGPVLRSLRQVPQRYAERGFELSVLWLTLLGVAAGFSTLRMWPQYYLPPIPWFALSIGLSLEQGLGYAPDETRPERRAWRSMLLSSLLLAGFCVGMLESMFVSLRQQQRKGAFADARPEQACEHIDRLAPPGEPIFIWGFDGDLYITCQRHPASRYVYATLVAGIVPPDWRIHLEWSARNSIQTLMSELDATHTPLILDSPARLHGVSMTQIKPLNRYLHDNYCEAGSFRSNDGRPLSAWLRHDLCPKPAEEHAREAPTEVPAGGDAFARDHGSVN